MHNLHLFVTWATSHDDAAKRANEYFDHYAASENVDYFTPFKVRKQGDNKVVILNDWAASRYYIDLSDEWLKKEYKNFFENISLKNFLHLENSNRLETYVHYVKMFAKLLSVESNLKTFIEYTNKNDFTFELFGIMDASKQLYNLIDTTLIENHYDVWISEYASNKLATPFGLTNDTIWDEKPDDSYDKYIVAIDVHT